LKTATLLGIVLLVIGAISLAYQGITYTTTSKKVDLGPIEVVHKDRQTIPLPPIIGAVSIIAGAVLLFGAGKNH
jgi:uncharacterized membrane protein HdeD (DUF308 family)